MRLRGSLHFGEAEPLYSLAKVYCEGEHVHSTVPLNFKPQSLIGIDFVLEP